MNPIIRITTAAVALVGHFDEAEDMASERVATDQAYAAKMEEVHKAMRHLSNEVHRARLRHVGDHAPKEDR